MVKKANKEEKLGLGLDWNRMLGFKLGLESKSDVGVGFGILLFVGSDLDYG